MVDPSKISVANARALLDFWFERQEKGLRAFCFKAWYDKKEEKIIPAEPTSISASTRKNKQRTTRQNDRPQSTRRNRKRNSGEESDSDANEGKDREGQEPDDTDLLNGGGGTDIIEQGAKSKGKAVRDNRRSKPRSKPRARDDDDDGGSDTGEPADLSQMTFGPPRGIKRNEQTAGRKDQIPQKGSGTGNKRKRVDEDPQPSKRKAIEGAVGTAPKGKRKVINRERNSDPSRTGMVTRSRDRPDGKR